MKHRHMAKLVTQQFLGLFIQGSNPCVSAVHVVQLVEHQTVVLAIVGSNPIMFIHYSLVV